MREKINCLVLAGLLCMLGSVQAGPLLHCHVEQADYVLDLVQRPVSLPYTVQAVPVGERFRFKAVVLGNDSQVAHVMVYTYSYRNKQASLLHEAQYHQPVVGAPTLTGEQVVVEPGLGRELHYDCLLAEGDAP